MLLRFLENCSGSVDGINLLHFRPGDVADVPGELAGVFVGEQWAVPADEPVAPVDPLPDPPAPVEPSKRAVAAPRRRKTRAAAKGKPASKRASK